MAMRKLLTLSLLFALTGCWTLGKKVPDRSESNQLGTVVTTTQMGLNDRAAGNNAAIGYTAGKLPESREKEVIQMFVNDQYGILGQPKLQTKTDFEKAAEKLLSTDAKTRASGEVERSKLAGENQDLKSKLTQAQRDFETARVKEESDHALALEQAREEGKQAVNKLISYIFFGLAALLGVSGVAVLVLAGSYPMFGPKAAFGLFGAAAVSAVMGVVILQLLKELDKHPSILWIGGGVITLILTGVGALLYSNHSHHIDNV